MAKHTRRAARKGSRKVRHSRRHGTRRMKGGNIKNMFFTRKTVAPRSNRALREGSVAFKMAKNVYDQNRSKIQELVKSLQKVKDGMYAEVKTKFPEYFGNKTLLESLKLVFTVPLSQRKNFAMYIKHMMQEKVSLDINKEDTQKARDALENYLKMIGKVKESVISKVLQKATSYSKTIEEMMDVIGVRGESIDKLFNHIENDTLTKGKALILLAVIEKHKDILTADSVEEVLSSTSVKLVKNGNGNGNGNRQVGGDQEWDKAQVTIFLLGCGVAGAVEASAIPALAVVPVICGILIIVVLAN